MRALCALGVFFENSDGAYELTPVGGCLPTDNSNGLRARGILNGEEWHKTCGELFHSVQCGYPKFDQSIRSLFVEHLTRSPADGALFNAAMSSSTEHAAQAATEAYEFSECESIVDLGDRVGAFLSKILQPNTRARSIVFDRPSVVESARGFLRNVDTADRYDAETGDFFE
jgi:hypothetical protein